MRRIVLEHYGEPATALRCANAPDVGAPGPGEVLFEVLASPINPADLVFCRGRYRFRPQLPATPGLECAGRVIAIGTDVRTIVPGDLVINLLMENWAERRRVREDDLIVLPRDMDIEQAAMLRANPPTAFLLLTGIVPLERGEWLIQNVANSAVGRLIIRLAKSRGVRTVNVVRRSNVIAELGALGADACVVDGPDLEARVREMTGGAPIRLGLDAVAGEATARLSECVADDGTICCYGSITGEDPVMRRTAVVFRNVKLTGFTLRRVLARRAAHEIRALYAELIPQVADGTLHVSVEARYSLQNVREAVSHAQLPGRSGKVLLVPRS